MSRNCPEPGDAGLDVRVFGDGALPRRDGDGTAMGVKKYTEKLNDYYARLDQNKAKKIKKSHVEKVMRKLEAKRLQLLDDLSSTEKPSKTERLTTKLKVADEQIERAHWLLEQIE